MSSESHPSAAGVRSGKPLDADVPCARCGYNLRGLNLHALCPECGAEVAGSIAAARDTPTALSHLGRRMLWRTWTGAMLLFAVALFCLAPRDWAYDDVPRSARFVLPRYVACAGVILLAAIASGSSRRWLNIGMISQLLAIATAAWVSYPKMLHYPKLSLAIPLLTSVLLYVHLWRVLRRLGNNRLAWQCLAIAIAMPPAHVLPYFAPSMQGPGGLGIWFFIMTIPGVGPPNLSLDVLRQLPSISAALLNDKETYFFILAYILPFWTGLVMLLLSERLRSALKGSR